MDVTTEVDEVDTCVTGVVPQARGESEGDRAVDVEV